METGHSEICATERRRLVLEREFQLLQRLPFLQRASVLSRLAQVVSDPRVSLLGVVARESGRSTVQALWLAATTERFLVVGERGW
jgi:delta 1-pyrroline-5-carboxylate dehydrogenase